MIKRKKTFRIFWTNIKYWSQVLLLPIYCLSYIIPRNKHIWVFGSTFGRRFADNPKYFYLYLNQHHRDDIRAIWISKNRGVVDFLNRNSLEAYYIYSLKGIWFALRAKVYIYDNYSKDICFTLSGGATKVNLWHGIPLKKIQKDNMFDLVRNPQNRAHKIKWALRRITDERPTDYVLATSEYLRPIFSSAFNTENVIVCGYPRNDFLISDSIENIMTDDEKVSYNMIKEKGNDNNIVLYMPTFRDSEYRFFELMSIAKLEGFLKENNIIFVVKLHPKSKINNKLIDVKSEYISILNPEYDPYPFLKLADVLVTDYSSIYFDFLLLDKPIIFFPYDLEEYLSNSRDMYFDYEEFTPGVKVFNQKELEDVILRKDDMTDEREIIKEKMFDNIENLGSRDLLSIIKGLNN